MTDDSKIIISGGFAGIIQVLTGHPFDTVKVRYIDGEHGNIFSCMKSIRSEGYKSFYRGVSSPLAGSLIINIQTFYIYTWLNKYFHKDPMIAGALTGFGLAFVESPSDLIKSRMQINPNMSYVKTLKEIGYINIYKGLNVTILRNSISVGLYFWGYENTKSLFENEYIGSFVGGSIAGLCCWGPNYPLDNIKTRLQTDTTGKYTGIIDCFKKTPVRK